MIFILTDSNSNIWTCAYNHDSYGITITLRDGVSFCEDIDRVIRFLSSGINILFEQVEELSL